MAKRVRVSTDNTTFYTLPGASGEFKTDMAAVNDTIFGQDYQSDNPSIGSWSVTAAAFFKGVAGYTATIYSGGTPVSTTAEACTLVTGKTYQVNALARRIMDVEATVTVNDNGSPVAAANIESIDYLSGKVTFVSGYTVTGAVTMDYDYVPMAAIGKARGYNLQQQAAEIDNTDQETARANGGWKTCFQGLKTVSLEISNVWDAANDFVDILAARSLVMVEISPDNTAGNASTMTLFRGFFKYFSQNQSGQVGALEEETLTLNLFVPSGELVLTPFNWYLGASSALPQAVQIVLNAYLNGTAIYVDYLADGTVGKTGQCIVTEASLQNAFDNQNEFSVTLMGTGAPADA